MTEDPRQPAGDRPSPSADEPLIPELVEPGGGDPFAQEPFGPGSDQYSGTPSTETPFGRHPSGPQAFAGGRFRVFSCSPGCIGLLLVVSLVLILLLNAIL